MVVETDASEIGYGDILKQKISDEFGEQLVKFTLGNWKGTQKNYSTIKRKILAIVLCISKFQDDLINKIFSLRVDCKATIDVLQKGVKNLISKHIFTR